MSITHQPTIYIGRKWCVRCPHSLQTGWSGKEGYGWGDQERWQEMSCLQYILRGSRLERICKLSHFILPIPSPTFPSHCHPSLPSQQSSEATSSITCHLKSSGLCFRHNSLFNFMRKKVNAHRAPHAVVIVPWLQCALPCFLLFVYSCNWHAFNTDTVPGNVLDVVIEWRKSQPRSHVLMDLSF